MPSDDTVFETEGQPEAAPDEVIIPLRGEEVAISRRSVETAVVRVETVTHTRDHLVEETTAHERVEIERVPIGRYVDVVPEIRQDGDLTIMPVVEEVVVVERRLLLAEEIHVRRVRTTRQHVETVQLRRQEALVTRTKAGGPQMDDVPDPTDTGE